MRHPIHRVIECRVEGPHAVWLKFDDGMERSIDFAHIVGRGIYDRLSDPGYFRQVEVDAESGTIVWPNGADFDPAQLHDWPDHASAFREMVSSWGSDTTERGGG